MLHAFAIYCVDPFGNYFLSYLTHIRLRSAFKLQVKWKYQIMNDKKMDQYPLSDQIDFNGNQGSGPALPSFSAAILTERQPGTVMVKNSLELS